MDRRQHNSVGEALARNHGSHSDVDLHRTGKGVGLREVPTVKIVSIIQIVKRRSWEIKGLMAS